jgi:hypothetical protein
MAMKVAVTSDVDVTVRPSHGGLVVFAYRAGFSGIVPDGHAEQIVAAGAGCVIKDVTPKKVRT